MRINWITKLKRYLPCVLLEIYLSSSYALYRWGVWIYPKQNNNKLLLYILFFMISFGLGYSFVAKRSGTNKKVADNSLNHIIFRALCIVDGVLMIPFCCARTGDWYPHVISSFTNLAVAYSKASKSVQAEGLIHYCGATGLFLMLPMFIIAFHCWEDLSKFEKCISIIELVWFFFVEISTGHNKGVFFYMVVIGVLVLVRACGSGKNLLNRVIIAALFIAFFGVYFYWTLSSRNSNTISQMESSGESIVEISLSDDDITSMIVDDYGYVSEDDDNLFVQNDYMQFEENYERVTSINPYYTDEFMHAYVNTEHFLYRLMPGKAKFFLVVSSSYLTQGYHGVNLGLNQKFTSSFGVGTFLLFRNIAKDLLGTDLYNRTLIYKINRSGYPISLKWGTAFTQWASDISYNGVVVLLFFAGMFIAGLWIDSIDNHSIIALIMLCVTAFFSLMFISWWLPGMSGGDFLMFHGYLLLWGCSSIHNIIGRKRVV